ncbi:MAG TPA: hypothetical protein VGK73_36270 [Polyangiaceae bacterium]
MLLAAVGCSLITDVDDFIGNPPAGGQAGSTAGNGATDPVGGSSAGGAGGEDDGGAPVAGGRSGGSSGSSAGSGLMSGTGGSESGGVGGGGSGGAGGTAARAGDGGTSGDEAGGMAGGGEAGAGGEDGGSAGTGGAGAGGSAGNAGSGGVGGVSGNAGKGGCAGADLETDPEHCGECDNPCASNQLCERGECVVSPCAGICAPREILEKNSSNEFRKDPIGTAAHCYEVTGYMPEQAPRIVCWNFASGRTLSVNDMSLPCTNGAGVTFPASPDANYCIAIGMGNNADAGFTLPPR